MRQRLLCLAAAALVAACAGDGPIYPVEDSLYDWVIAPDAIVPGSAPAPDIADPVVTFRLPRGGRLSALRTGEDWRTGQTRLFGFDIRLNPEKLGRERVEVSRLYRSGDPETVLASVQLDADRGVTVMGRRCIAPEDLGTWHRVEMRIKLRDDDQGYLEVFCDRKPIWAQTGLRTTFPPVCRRSEGCNTALAKPVSYEWRMGLLTDRPVSRPVSIQMRKLHHRLLLYVPHRAGRL